jgi:hypothetical protein
VTLKSVTKTGRPQGEYRTTWGDKIVGLRRLKDGRWRTSHPNQITFSEPDERLAVARFRRWQADQHNEKLVFPLEKQPSGPPDKAFLAARSAATASGFSRLQIKLETGEDPVFSVVVGSSELFLAVRHMILTEPQRLAEGTGIEQLGYLTNIKKPQDSPSMNDVGELYLTSNGKISGNWASKTKSFWTEFVTIVGAANCVT